MMFDLYWRLLGLPLSRFKGVVTDAVPFSLVETGLWIGVTATLVFLLAWLPARVLSERSWSRWLRARGVRAGAFAVGPVFLGALGLGQGAFPGSLAPTAWRTPLAERLDAAPLPQEDFHLWASAREARLRAAFSGDAPGAQRWRAFQGVTEREVLAACDTSLNTVLASLGLPAGRTVRAYKDMGPWTTTMGLVYGGPAFHDPFFGEIAIVRDEDLPAPHYWRLTAACHEAAHAKGFTREMDAEILTQLALARHADPSLRTLADVHFLRKTGLVVAWPESLVAESQRVRAQRSAVERTQPVVRALRSAARRLRFQNDAAKYGARAPEEAWNPRHPFFATVHHAAGTTAGEPPHGREQGP